ISNKPFNSSSNSSSSSNNSTSTMLMANNIISTLEQMVLQFPSWPCYNNSSRLIYMVSTQRHLTIHSKTLPIWDRWKLQREYMPIHCKHSIWQVTLKLNSNTIWPIHHRY